MVLSDKYLKKQFYEAEYGKNGTPDDKHNLSVAYADAKIQKERGRSRRERTRHIQSVIDTDDSKDETWVRCPLALVLWRISYSVSRFFRVRCGCVLFVLVISNSLCVVFLIFFVGSASYTLQTAAQTAAP